MWGREVARKAKHARCVCSTAAHSGRSTGVLRGGVAWSGNEWHLECLRAVPREICLAVSASDLIRSKLGSRGGLAERMRRGASYTARNDKNVMQAARSALLYLSVVVAD